jgi:hypothetical protein
MPPIPSPDLPISQRIICGPLCAEREPRKKPEKKTTPTMKTTPATIPTAAAA